MVKVYLVEDEIIIRQSIKNSIDWEKEGYEFVGDASDGELALPVILKEKPDILITDAIRYNHNARYSFMTIDDFIDMGLRSSDEKKYYIENLCVAFSLLQ